MTSKATKCPLCGKRRGKRACPALGQTICAVCCGTKRQGEIACPPDCRYLVSAESHPPAALQRRREQDLRFLLPQLQGLTERQQHVTLLVQQFLRAGDESALGISDADVVQATRALAETYETASRGIIYEHSAGHVSAERLSTELKNVIEQGRAEGLKLPDGDVAVALRRIESGARDAGAALGPSDDPSAARIAYLQLLRRVFQTPTAAEPETGETPSADKESGSGLVIP